MNLSRSLWPGSLVFFLAVVPALAGGDLGVAATVVNSRYCLGPNGAITLDLTVHFTYRNVGQASVVLPRFSRLSGYTLFRNEGDLRAGRALTRAVFHWGDIFDRLRIEPARPDPMLFEAVQPGGIAGREDEVTIPVSPERAGGLALLGTSVLAQFTIDNWPGHKHIEKSRQVWAQLGTLWASQDTPPPVPISIESKPNPVRCVPRVD
jgi:hypothetical protein